MNKEILKNLKNINYKIVSLGCNCLPRTVLTRWKLKPRKAQGELSMPFDLATFETFEITENIKNNFKDFFEGIKYISKTKKYFFNLIKIQTGYWIKTPDKIKFIHEKKLKYSDKARLTTIYEKRINNFTEAINSQTPTLFVQLVGDCQDIENLYNCILEKRGTKPFKLLVIDTQNIINTQNENIKVLKLPYPNENYKNNWWKKRFYNTKQGIAFEEKVAQTAIELINGFK